MSTLQSLLKEIQLKENKKKIGKIEKVLIENKMKNQDNYFGRLNNSTPVIIKNSSEKDVGQIINIKINGSNGNNLFGIKENFKSEVAA